MPLSGRLEDIPLADIVQFVQLGGRTGTLRLVCPHGRGSIGFHRGRIVGANEPASRRLGEELVARGLVEAHTVALALERQRLEQPHRSLGQLLLAEGAIDLDALKHVISRTIIETIATLVGWTEGEFEFALDDLPPPDDLTPYSDAVSLPAGLDTRMVLLEAMQVIDEHDRHRRRNGSTQPPTSRASGAPASSELGPLGPSSRPGSPAPVKAKPHLHVLTGDDELASALSTIASGDCAVSRVALRDAGSGLPHEPTPIVLLDVRGDSSHTESISYLRRTRPRATLVAIPNPSAPPRLLHEAGALALVPPDVEAIVACVRSILCNRADQSEGGAIAASVQSSLARLRRVTRDLRAGALHSTVSLNLMHAVSESVERAILFVVRRDVMIAIGAFGYDRSGQPLAERTRGLEVPLAAALSLAECIGDGQVRAGSHLEHPLPPPVSELLGPPRTGEVAIFPVHGGQRTIAVVYADNGKVDRPIEGMDILELAVTQVGLAFENELLRRQLRAKQAKSP